MADAPAVLPEMMPPPEKQILQSSRTGSIPEASTCDEPQSEPSPEHSENEEGLDKYVLLNLQSTHLRQPAAQAASLPQLLINELSSDLAVEGSTVSPLKVSGDDLDTSAEDLTPDTPQTTDSFDTSQSSLSVNGNVHGAVVKIQVCFARTKNGVVEILGNVGETIVLIKAKVKEVGGVPVKKLKEAATGIWAAAVAFSNQARSVFGAEAVWLQDGYVYIAATLQGKATCIKARAMKMYVATVKVVRDNTAKVRCRSEALFNSLRSRVDAAVKTLEPYCLWVHNGTMQVVASINGRLVVVQAKLSDTYSALQVCFADSVKGACAAIQGYTHPLHSRVVATGNAVEQWRVQIKDGIVSIRGAAETRIVALQANMSELLNSIKDKASDALRGPKSTFMALVESLTTLVSLTYGSVCEQVQMVQTVAKDGFVFIFVTTRNRLIAFRLSVAEFVEHLQLETARICTITCASVVQKMQQATSGIKSLANDPTMRVSAVSAAGGAATLGASGGAAGFIAGGAVGAAVGVPGALFTFGLSIPVAAAIGAGTGLCVGTATGGAAGLVTGGAAGYNAHKHREQLGNGVTAALSKAKEYKSMAATSTSKLRARVSFGATGAHA